jgi:trigger factor
MRATVQPEEGNRVRLSVEIDEAEFEKALNDTYRKLAKEVRVPGFRPGKAPRRILEARIGPEAVRGEALQDALPEFYAKALRDSDIDPIAAPEIDITGGRETGPISFDALVEVRPTVSIAGYSGLRVTVPPVEPTEDEVVAQLDRLRDQFGELEVVARPARDGDHATVDIKAYRHSEVVEGLSTDDLLYEVGSGSVVPELDEQMRGAKAGDIFKFNAQVGDQELAFQVLVKEVKEKILPELTDEWAEEASEFSTVDELRADIRSRVATIKRLQANFAVRDSTLKALAELVAEDVPDALVDQEVQRRLHDLAHRLEPQGVSLEQYVAAAGGEEMITQLRQAAVESVKVDLALRSLAEAESIEVSDQEFDDELTRLAKEVDVSKTKLRGQLERADRLTEVRSDMRSGKALKWLLEHVELVDEAGNPVDRAELEPPEEGPEAGSVDDADGAGPQDIETVES